MPIVYKIDILKALKDKGFNTNRIRKEKILSEGVLTKARQGIASCKTIETLCKILECQPSDLIEYIPDDKSL